MIKNDTPLPSAVLLALLAWNSTVIAAWSTIATSRSNSRISPSGFTTALASSSDESPTSAAVYSGPILPDPSEVVVGISLGELGIDLFAAPSTVAPGQLGLFAILSEDAESATIPGMSLLCGYSREGTFAAKDEGDKTVGFALAGPSTAVFYERQLMSIMDALELAAETKGANNSCGLAGHALVQNENQEVEIYLDEDSTFKRYYVPDDLNQGKEEEEGALTVQNFGQFCNDLAWSFDNPPSNKEEYDADDANIVQLVWRLEFDEYTNSLIPSWPVSVLSRDVTFENADAFMELGTRYGWNYWQATVDLEAL
jgi:hypothetical protein